MLTDPTERENWCSTSGLCGTIQIFSIIIITTTNSHAHYTIVKKQNRSYRSFRYASPCLWNKLPVSFRQPNPDHFFLTLLNLIL